MNGSSKCKVLFKRVLNIVVLRIKSIGEREGKSQAPFEDILGLGQLTTVQKM